MAPVEDILQTRKNVSFELWIFKIPFFCLFPTEQYIASLSIPSISNKRHKCLGSKDNSQFWRNVFFLHENKMFIKHFYEHWTSSGNKLLQWPLWYDLSSFSAKYWAETPRGAKENYLLTSLSPAADRQCRQGRPPPDSGRSSSTWGGRWWTWWGRLPDCTCRYHWLASRRSWWEGWEGGQVSWPLVVVKELWCLNRHVCQSSLWAGCQPHHWQCRSTYSRCGIWRRPGNIEMYSPQVPWFGSLSWNGCI